MLPSGLVKRAISPVITILKWPLFGALLGAGALAVAHRFGPDVARELGGNAGAGFATAVARVNQELQQLQVAGERGRYV